MDRKEIPPADSGFTLIELLTVVIIIGVIAAIALPSLLGQREKAWRKAAMSDLRSASVIMESYFDDKGTYLPSGGHSPGLTPPYDFKTSGDANGDVQVMLPVAGVTTATHYCLEADHLKLGGPGSIDFHVDSSMGRPQAGGC